MLEVRELSKRYGAFEAVKGVSFEVGAGEVFGFLGPNGAGKTTTLRMITGLLRPTSGVVRVDGFDVHSEPLEAKARMGFIPDRPHVYGKLTAVEFLRFIAGLRRMGRRDAAARIEQLLELLELAPWGGRLVESFSHGMKQRLVVAAALLPRPKLLVVDEPMVGLDPRGARLIKRIFRELGSEAGVTVFLSTHSLEVAEALCDRLAILSRGSVVALGTLEALRARVGAGEGEGRLEEVFLQITAEAEAGGAAATAARDEDVEARLAAVIAAQRVR